MKILFIAILFANAAFGFSLFVISLQKQNKDDRGREMLTFNTVASIIWSLGAGLLIVQTNEIGAHLARLVGLLGTLLYMISLIRLFNSISGIKKVLANCFEIFTYLGFGIWIYGLHPNAFSFNMSFWGMSFSFKNEIYGTIYTVYFLLCSLIMLFNIIALLKNSKKSLRFFGKAFLLALIIILLGSVSDMILPLLGVNSAPGSGIAQFWGLLITWYAMDNVSHSQITVKNMSLQVYETISSPVLMGDTHGDIKVCNESAKQFFNLNLKEDEPVSIYDLFTPPEDLDLVNGTDVLDYDAFCKVNGVYCHIHSNEVIDRFNETIGFISIFTDLTKQLEDRKNIEEAREEAVAANKAKSLFLANMSHEIRTPVNAIMGFSEIALSDNPPAKIAEYLEDIKNASNTLLLSINDILNISKIESGKMEIVNEDYSLKSLLKNVSRIIAVQAEKKKLSYNLEISGFVPEKLYGDDVRIQEILINLLNNSVKYTETGNIVLCIFGDRIDADTVMLSFSIKDTGIGIKEEDIKNLFVAYERMDKEKNHRAEGTGLGLSIVQGYIELMDGTIDVRSEYGKGSEFIVRLRQKVMGEKLLSAEDIMKSDLTEKQIGKIRVRDTKVLVVDDNKVNLKVASKTFEKYGLTTDLASGGAEAVSMCRGMEYPIVFMDHMMPEMDGEEAMHEIRKLSDYYENQCKIVVLTANVVDGIQNTLLEAGFDEYLSKPINYSVFEKILTKFIPADKIV